MKTLAVTSFLVGGLTNGTAYRFSVAAVNKYGTGSATSLSAAVTPKAPTAPGVPGSVAAVAGFRQISVSWTAPASSGGAPVTGYRISTRPATSVLSVNGSARSAVLSGLADGTAHKGLVAAVNSVGAGRAGVSGAVTPHVTVPGLMVKVASVTASGSTVTLATAPASLDQALSPAGFGITSQLTQSQVTSLTPARAGVKLILGWS